MRIARVGHDEDRTLDLRDGRRKRVVDRLRSDGAIHSDAIGAGRAQPQQRRQQRIAGGRLAVLDDGERHHDGERGSVLLGRRQRKQRLFDAPEGLEQQAVRPSGGDRGDMFREDIERFVVVDEPERPHQRAERADGAGDVRLPAGRRACDAHAGGVERLKLLAQLVRRELEPIACERVGRDEFGPRGDVVRVRAFDDIGMVVVEPFDARGRLRRALEQQGAHRAVGEHDSRGPAKRDRFQKRRPPRPICGYGGRCPPRAKAFAAPRRETTEVNERTRSIVVLFIMASLLATAYFVFLKPYFDQQRAVKQVRDARSTWTVTMQQYLQAGPLSEQTYRISNDDGKVMMFYSATNRDGSVTKQFDVPLSGPASDVPLRAAARRGHLGSAR